MGFANEDDGARIYVKRVGTYRELQVLRDGASSRTPRIWSGFGTAGYEVKFYYWLFVPVMLIVLVHDAKRMLIDPVKPRDGGMS